VGSDFALCYVVVSKDAISISAEMPLEDEYFFASTNGGQAYIGQMKQTELNELPDTEAIAELTGLATQEIEQLE
jgi:hypothetical protein